jgi:arsenate reductase
MSRPVVIYHNPRCSKSRQTLALLRERGVEPEVVEYLKTPLDAAGVETLIARLGLEPHALVRSKEAAYARHALSPSSSAAEVARAIASDPILLERPVVVVGERAAIGRPPENVLGLL